MCVRVYIERHESKEKDRKVTEEDQTNKRLRKAKDMYIQITRERERYFLERRMFGRR